MNTSYLYSPERISALSESGFLDSHGDFVATAAKVCKLLDADVCQINALDGKMQKTIACFPFAEYAMLPVEDTGCQVPISTRKTFLVKQTQIHPVTCTMEWTSWAKAYLGSPIFYNGQAIGSICVLGEEERDWTPEQVKTLESIAQQIGKQLETKRS